MTLWDQLRKEIGNAFYKLQYGYNGKFPKPKTIRAWEKRIQKQVDNLAREVTKIVIENEKLQTPPSGYPECTSALVHAMAHPHGKNLLRIMHANEKLIAEQQKEIEQLKHQIGTMESGDD